jgi:PST family polysaccharide transporter
MSVISIVLFALALPWGAVGVSASGALSYVLITTPLVCRGATCTGPVRGKHLIAALTPLALAALPTFAAMQGLLRIAHLAPPLIIAVALAAAYGTFAAALAILPQGRRLLRDSWDLRTTLRAAR